jgi:hypothetical protein
MLGGDRAGPASRNASAGPLPHPAIHQSLRDGHGRERGEVDQDWVALRDRMKDRLVTTIGVQSGAREATDCPAAEPGTGPAEPCFDPRAGLG